MAEIKISKFLGLHTAANPLSEASPGSLRVARNVRFNSAGHLEPRGGLWVKSAVDTAAPKSIGTYGDYVFTSSLLSSTYYLKRWNPSTGAVSTVAAEPVSPVSATPLDAPAAPPDNTAFTNLQFVEAKGSVYFNPYQRAVQKLDVASTGKSLAAGVPRAVGSRTLSLNQTGTVGKFLGDGDSCAYRYVWGYKDATGRVILGEPSGREVIVNSSTTTGYSSGVSSNVTHEVIIPPGITKYHFLQVYRTVTEDATDALGDAIVPDEDYYLVYEVTGFSTTELNTNKYVTSFSDTVPDLVLSVPLYTNADDGDGYLSSNGVPPWCRTLCWADNRMLYGNTSLPQALTITLLATNPTGLTNSSAVQSGDQLIFGGLTFQAASSEDAAATPKLFKLYNTGSTSRDVAETVRSLCRVISLNCASTGYLARYLEGGDLDLVGSFELYAKDSTVAAVTPVVNARGNAWEPALPTAAEVVATTKVAVSTTAEAVPNRVYWSKLGIPEAVGPLSYVDVGPQSTLYKLVPYGDRVFAFTSGGTYLLSPSGSAVRPFTVEEYDVTLRLIAAETPKICNDGIYAFTNYGVVRVTPEDWTPVDTPISDLIEAAKVGQISDAGLTGMFAVADPEFYEYHLWTTGQGTPLNEDDSSRVQFFTYNTKFQRWTTGDVPYHALGYAITCGTTMPALNATGNKFSLGRPLYGDALFLRSQQTPDSFDANGSFSHFSENLMSGFTVSSVTSNSGGTMVFVNGGGTLSPAIETPSDIVFAVGDYAEFTTGAGVVTAVNGSSITVKWDTVASSPAGASNVFLYKAIPVEVETTYLDAGIPGYVKHFAAATLHFKYMYLYLCKPFFNSDLSDTAALTDPPSTAMLSPQSLTSLVLNKRAAEIWVEYRGRRIYPKNKRLLVPTINQRAGYFSVGIRVREACSLFALNGITIEFTPTSERNTF